MTEAKFHRNTPQRRVILEEVRKTSAHPTAAELYDRVRRRLPKISLGTVYRNLDLLAGMGKIQKLDLGGGEARFDGNLRPHYHVRCVRCGRVDDVEGLPGDTRIECPREAAGYEVIGHRLEFLGICPRCKDRPEPEPSDQSERRLAPSGRRPGQP